MSAPPLAPVARWRPLTAVLWTSVLLVGGETILALALRWHHAFGYVLTCAVLTVLLAAAIGGLGSLLRLPLGWVLLVWVFAAGLLVQGYLAGVLFAAAALPPSGAVRRWRGWLLGSCAAAGLLVAFPRGEGIAESLGLGRLLGASPGAAVGGAMLFALLYQIVPRILARWPRGARTGRGEPALALLVGAVGLALAGQPYFSRPSGTYRLPRPDELAGPAAADRAARPHVFLLVLDTLRADHLSVYGYERETTPSLARLLAERPNAVVFPRAYANGTWTVPSHATLLTGMLPHEHGVHFALDGSVRFRFGLAAEATTLASRLRGQGYRTLGTFANHWLRIIRGLDRGFDRYFRAHHSRPLPYVGERLRALLIPGVHPEAGKTGSRARDVNEAVLTMVEPWSRGPAPLFVFANYADTHGPYLPPPGFRGRFAPTSWREESDHLSIAFSPERIDLLRARYDEELLYLDHQLGLFFAALERIGVLDDSWVFITSDHGEAFGEHGVTEHGTAVFDEIVRVPLLVFPPAGVTLTPAEDPVSLVDVATTIAHLGGAELDGPGRDLRAPADRASGVAIEFYGDRGKARRHGPLAAEPAVSFLRGRFKLIRRGTETYELYDLVLDPGETRNLAAIRPDVVEEWKGELPVFAAPTKLDAGSDLDGAEQARIEAKLRAAGYVGG